MIEGDRICSDLLLLGLESKFQSVSAGGEIMSVELILWWYVMIDVSDIC